MTITANAPRLNTAPDPLRGLEGDMSYGQIFETIGHEIQANNGVPTVGQYLEAQSAAADLKPRYQTEHETGMLHLDHYACTDGSRVSVSVGNAIKRAASVDWIQDEATERIFSDTARALRSDDETADDDLLPVVDHVTKRMHVEGGLGPDELDRMVALSRFGRHRLAEQGVDVRKYLNHRDRTRVNVPVGASSRGYSHEERETPPYGIPGLPIRDNGKIVGRAAVPRDREPGDVTLGRFLDQDLRGRDIMWDVLEKYGMDAEQLALANEIVQRLAIFDKLERQAYKSRRLPEFGDVMARMFPDRSSYTVFDVAVGQDAMTRLRFASERRMMPRGKGMKFKGYVAVRDMLHRGGQAVAGFTEKRTSQAVAAIRSVGAVAMSRVATQNVRAVAPSRTAR